METYKGQTRVELRSPDAGCNPYLVYALLIYAGIKGIEEKLGLPEEMSEKEATLPTSREEAAKLALESDFVRKYVPEGILKEYTGF